MMVLKRLILSFSFLTVSCTSVKEITALRELPLFKIEDMVFMGGFRLPANDFGISSMNYSPGPIAYHPQRNSVFATGHNYQDAIAEFKVPEIINSKVIAELNISGEPVQTFTTVLDRPEGGVVQNINTIGGMVVIGNELVVNAYEYYDAPADNTVSTLVFKDLQNIGSCNVEGYFNFTGSGAAHHARWVSPIPDSWKALVGGDYIVGSSSGDPIISRWPVGPTAFAFKSADLLAASGSGDSIQTTTLLNYSLGHPLASDLSNETGENDIWTHLTRATYGIIVPGTRTYLVLGYTGGHESGICYKCEQDDGNTCGGYCPPDPSDFTQYYWAYDMNDLLAVKADTLLPHEVRPYAYGKLDTPFQGSGSRAIGGGSFDPASGRLFLTIQNADRLQGTYSNPPVVAVYRFDT